MHSVEVGLWLCSFPGCWDGCFPRTWQGAEKKPQRDSLGVLLPRDPSVVSMVQIVLFIRSSLCAVRAEAAQGALFPGTGHGSAGLGLSLGFLAPVRVGTAGSGQAQAPAGRSRAVLVVPRVSLGRPWCSAPPWGCRGGSRDRLGTGQPSTR